MRTCGKREVGSVEVWPRGSSALFCIAKPDGGVARTRLSWQGFGPTREILGAPGGDDVIAPPLRLFPAACSAFEGVVVVTATATDVTDGERSSSGLSGRHERSVPPFAEALVAWIALFSAMTLRGGNAFATPHPSTWQTAASPPVPCSAGLAHSPAPVQTHHATSR
jgi:hypothetical protein